MEDIKRLFIRRQTLKSLIRRLYLVWSLVCCQLDFVRNIGKYIRNILKVKTSHYLPDQKHCSIVTEVGVQVDVFRETGYGFGEKAQFRAITINGSNDKTKQK